MIIRPHWLLVSLVTAFMAAGLLWGQSLWGQRPQSDSRADAASKKTTSLRFAENSPKESPESVPRTARPDKHALVDPIKANGPLFVDWPKPDAVLLFSGEQDGHLEPCGCAGLQNQKGGLKRRHTLIKQLESKNWPVVALDTGGQIRRFGIQSEIKYRRTLESLMEIGYSAIGFGPQELQLDVLSILINVLDDEMLEGNRSPLISANVGVLAYDSGFTNRYKIIEAGGLRIGVTSVLGKEEVAKLQLQSDLVIEDPKQAIPQILPQLLNEHCDHLVLLAHAPREEAKELARRFHEFDWVTSAKGADEPPNEAEEIKASDGARAGDDAESISKLIETGHKGMYVVVIGLYKEGPVRFRYQRVPLDHRFEDSPEMERIFTDYQKELETSGLEGLGIKELNHPSGRLFAGTGECIDCHSEAHEIHKNTPHAHATQSLIKLNPSRHHDPECLSCHVTGWDPQRFFPFVSGYLNQQKTPHLNTNGCENCHGPGRRHADAENGNIDASDDEIETLRAALRLKIVKNEGNMEGQAFPDGGVAEMCMSCHDLDNSPDFDFQTYWPEVEHHGKD